MLVSVFFCSMKREQLAISILITNCVLKPSVLTNF